MLAASEFVAFFPRVMRYDNSEKPERPGNTGSKTTKVIPREVSCLKYR